MAYADRAKLQDRQAAKHSSNGSFGRRLNVASLEAANGRSVPEVRRPSTSGIRVAQEDSAPGPLAVAWRDKWILLAIGVLTGLVVYVAFSLVPPTFVAKASIMYPYTGSVVPLTGGRESRSLTTEARRILSTEVLQEAADSLESPTDVVDLRDRVSADPAFNANVIVLEATAPTANEAAERADAVVAAYRNKVVGRQTASIRNLRERSRTIQQRISEQQDELATQLRQARDQTGGDGIEQFTVAADPAASALYYALQASVGQLSEVQKQLDELQTAGSAEGVRVLEPAQVPGNPEQPRPKRNAATAVILVLAAVSTVRWWKASPEPPMLANARTAEQMLDAPVLAEVARIQPANAPAEVVAGDDTDLVNAYGLIGATIPVGKSVLVTAAAPGISCRGLALNTAAALGRNGFDTYIVEGNARDRLTEAEAPDERPGLTDVLAGRLDIESCELLADFEAQENDAQIRLVPWGTGSSVLHRTSKSQLPAVVAAMAKRMAPVLVVGPPLTTSADAMALAESVDSILVVVSPRTSLGDVDRLRRRVDQSGKQVIGVIFQHQPSRWMRRRKTVPVTWAPLVGATHLDQSARSESTA